MKNYMHKYITLETWETATLEQRKLWVEAGYYLAVGLSISVVDCLLWFWRTYG